MITARQFIEELIVRFAELRAEVEEWTSLPHVQMGCFARVTQEAIDSGDFDMLRSYFAFAHQHFHDADPYLKNAFYVSYLEHLDFRGPHGERARDMMSSLLRQGWQDINDYLDDLFRKGQNAQKRK